MTSANFHRCITELSKNALKRFHRQIVILQGSQSWANTLFQEVTSHPFSDKKILDSEITTSSASDKSQWYIYSDDMAICGNVNKQTFRNKLGTESQFVVFYHEQLNIDALAALSGTLVSGGILFIVMPENIESSDFYRGSFFNQRLADKILHDEAIAIIKEADGVTNPKVFHGSVVRSGLDFERSANKTLLEMNCLTQEQLRAVKQVIQVVKGHRNRPLVLTADRGRGKSSALAIACAELLKNAQTQINIAITATHRKSIDVFFTQLTQSLKGEQTAADINISASNRLEHKNGSVQFIAVDELIKTKTTFNLLLVDEAASIPLYFLNQLLAKHHRMVFASTVHGYEGAGRSFTLKFQKNVAQKYPESKTLNISQPIRWAENDPVEAFIYDLCLLNAETPKLPKGFSLSSSLLEFEQVNTEALMLDELLLQKVFAVLVTAHYQTSPNDLRLLLDNPNITLVTLSSQKQLLGVALLLKEGATEDEQLKGLIQSNQRRLKDQFIPQSLLTHCGEENSFNYSYLRVMRIAILPELQDKGLGSVFLSYIESYASQLGIDFIGTSFGANKTLLNFWQQQAYKIARIGFTKDKASGEHSALLLKAINKQHEPYLDKIEDNFYQSFDYLLAEQYKDLLPELVWQIMTYCPIDSLPILNKFDLKAIDDFYTKKRQYSVCVYHLHKWLQHQMKRPFDPDMVPIINKIFQRQEVSSLTEAYGFAGKKAFNNHLIKFIESYCQKNK
ncbi:GNAT family N-acetyltransferase [Pseudocolwellia sp. AS88]|uniref:GNAT family N-acetyltransferase n=1 Tax=Pseudocolwellia sp. AS88 TaxID=3063958 RepID=UPI0026F194CA|nr:GNAT family N-acetyltransferase [Pseudocolwellia sp. AS88]MDO7086211.1 GNAT family N-acetyltransferase [Pseudocolwellia sp. AS88]